MGNYITADELRQYVGISDTDDSALIDASIAAAEEQVERICGRYFYQDGTTSARGFYPLNSRVVYVDDISTTTGLTVKTDEGDDGTYETTWASTDYQLEPLNGLVDGQTWPYTKIVAVDRYLFPTCNLIAPVQVTARWGWAAVPDAVKQATFIAAEYLYKMKDAPLGVAGFGEFGALRVREHPVVQMLLAPYVRHPVLAR